MMPLSHRNALFRGLLLMLFCSDEVVFGFCSRCSRGIGATVVNHPSTSQSSSSSLSLFNFQRQEDDEYFSTATSTGTTEEPYFVRESENIKMIALTVLPSLIGFFLWGEISHNVAAVIEYYAEFQAKNVDGNAFANNLLRPTINGVVVPATSIALGTLFATTVNVLWERQVKMRSCINKEVGELRLLRRALFGCFGTAQHSRRRETALQLLSSYTDSLIRETKTDSIARLEDIQRNGGISMNEIDEIADMLHGVDGAAASRQGSVAMAEDLLVSLNGHRSERVAITLSYFPNIHWVLLVFLYMSIQLAFFIDSNQGILQYLNSFQLRVLYAVIVGVGSGAGMLLSELNDPFQGSLGVTLEAMQLKSFEDLLESDVKDAQKETVGFPLLFSSFDYDNHRNRKWRRRPKYNTGNTLYFHLLTSPRAATVRVIGDVVAWVFRQSYRLVSSVKQVFLRLWSPISRRRVRRKFLKVIRKSNSG